MRTAAVSLLVVLWTCGFALAQSSTSGPAPQVSRIVGVVTQLQGGSLTLHADAGTDVAVRLPANAIVLRVPPGATDLNSAAKISMTDVSVGDRLLVRGRLSDDGKSAVALTIMVMTKADLANAQEAERLDWQKRGIGGTVTALDTEKKEITIAASPSGPAGTHSTPTQRITLAPNAVPQRYAPDSVRFGDAKPSSIDQIKIGDQVRALGTKTEDGSFRAEKLVSGTFRNLDVTVLSVDPESKTLSVKNAASGETVLVRTNADSALRRLTPDMARSLAKPNSGSDSAQVIERAPALAITEIKSGEPLIVLSTEGTKSAEVTAILVLAGVEPIVAARSQGSGQVAIGPWSMGKGAGDDAP